MDTIRQEEFDLEQFKQDLQELAQAYISTTQAGNTQEQETIFESMLRLTSEAFTQAKDEETKTAIKTAVEGLRGTPDPYALWIYMLGYGLQESIGKLYRDEEYDERDTLSLVESLRIKIITHTSRIAALKACTDEGYDLTQVLQAEFDSIVEEITSLPNRFLITQALAITKEQLEKLEHPLTIGPRALQAAGLRSYLKIHRAVMKRLCDISRRIPPDATC